MKTLSDHNPFTLAGLAALFCAVLLFLPEPAFAWGPGVHMVTGNWLLQNLAMLPVAAATALVRFPGQFLHGCLSPDIFIGKGSRPKEGHSHNWSTGLALLERARSLRGQSYAYGYLAHLAADTVAHNVFVPKGFSGIPGSGRTAHVYLEMQADRLLAWDVEDALAVFHEAGSKGNSAMLQKAMGQRMAAFWMKKRLFEGSIYLGGAKAWRGSLSLLDKVLPVADRDALDYLLAVSTRAIVSMIKEGADSPVMLLDPIGAEELARQGAKQKNILAFRLKNLLNHHVETESGILLPDILSSLPESLAQLPPVCVKDVDPAIEQHNDSV